MTDVTDPDRSFPTSSRPSPTAPPAPSPCPSCRCPPWCCPAPSSPSPSTATPSGSRSRLPSAGDGRVLLVAPPAAGDPLTSAELGVVARVPSRGSLPSGQPAAIVQAEGRARILARHTSDRGADHADVELLAEARPTPAGRGRRPRAAGGARGDRQAPPEPAPARDPPHRRRARRAGRRRRHLERGRRRRCARRCCTRSSSSRACSSSPTGPRDHLAELEVTEKIRADVREGMEKQQREFLLRQQLAAIRKELGEGDDDGVGDYRAQLESRRPAREGPRAAHREEIGKLERTSEQSPEDGWIRTWLDTVLDLPWSDAHRRPARPRRRPRDPRRRPPRPRRREGPHRRVPGRAQAARRARPASVVGGRGSGAVIALVGPPGVGKTVARRVGRPGAGPQVRPRRPRRRARRGRDPRSPAHLRRRAARAASCGPSARPGSMNPVVLLDEIDKVGADYRRRPDRGAARGARPGAEPHVPRPLPRARPRPVRRACSSPPPT